ncbi:MAG: L-seryl-tRNA(Sec) selenium transferase [Burkholderiaceae bacterium]|nr:L-seryl-tRNA(Sec) selenium transferase [Burkholderiaceae bacterium]
MTAHRRSPAAVDDGPAHHLLAGLPSVDRLLGLAECRSMIDTHGRKAVTESIRAELETVRRNISAGIAPPPLTDLLNRIDDRVVDAGRPSLSAVFNLSGTVLHSNLGRALLPEAAVEAMNIAATQACTLEYDVAAGVRGERDLLVEPLLTRLTGAEAATVVNNNAAAVLLALNTLAARKEVLVSRGELVEIGGAFRIPDVMRSAQARLVEVGTTNKTHKADFENAIGPKSALLLKIHTSNYAIVGFTSSVARADLAAVARAHGLPFVEDLGSGTLVDLTAFGLPKEPTPQEALRAGVDLVTFSGDKLLGGPQAGLIIGRRDLVEKIRKNPLKRALRADKLTLAALESVLRLYLDPDRLAERLPTLRTLTRTQPEIRAQAERVFPALCEALAGVANVTIEPCSSQIGSGALPTEQVPSYALVVRRQGKRSGPTLARIERGLRRLAQPVIGRMTGGALLLDLRCLDPRQEATLSARLAEFRLPPD